eukprot:sb/3466018/
MTYVTDDTPDSETPTPPLPGHLSTGDTACGVVCIILFVVGTLANLPALIFFIGQRRKSTDKKRVFDGLFICTCTTDLLICIGMLPIALSFLGGRDTGLLSDSPWVCHVWAALWYILPYFSVACVTVLSFTRTYTLIRPLSPLKDTVVFGTLAAYMMFLVFRTVISLFLRPAVEFLYDRYTVMCVEAVGITEYPNYETYYVAKLIINQILLLAPVLPITISCIVCFIVFHKYRLTRRGSKRTLRLQSEATITILMVTVVYWLCNVPMVINYIGYHVTRNNKLQDDPYYNVEFLAWYSWPIVLTVSVGVNATVNPIIYATRMRLFREFIVGKVRRWLPWVTNSTNWTSLDDSQNHKLTSIDL